MKIKNFHITWDNHLRLKEKYLWQPMEVESTGRTISWEYTLDDGTVIKGSKHMSAPEPPNPFTPVPEDAPEDWRDDGDDEDD